MSVAVMTVPAMSVNLKKARRDVERLLRRPNLPSDMRRDQERKLASIEDQLAQKAVTERVKQLQEKSKYVRFVELQKARRRVQQAAKGQDAQVLMDAKKDLAYVEHFPANVKYISLFPNQPITDERLLAKRNLIREEIAASKLSTSAELCDAEDSNDESDESGDDDDDDDEDDNEDDFDDDSDGEGEESDQGDGDEDESNGGEDDSDSGEDSDGLEYMDDESFGESDDENSSDEDDENEQSTDEENSDDDEYYDSEEEEEEDDSDDSDGSDDDRQYKRVRITSDASDEDEDSDDDE